MGRVFSKENEGQQKTILAPCQETERQENLTEYLWVSGLTTAGFQAEVRELADRLKRSASVTQNLYKEIADDKSDDGKKVDLLEKEFNTLFDISYRLRRVLTARRKGDIGCKLCNEFIKEFAEIINTVIEGESYFVSKMKGDFVKMNNELSETNVSTTARCDVATGHVDIDVTDAGQSLDDLRDFEERKKQIDQSVIDILRISVDLKGLMSGQTSDLDEVERNIRDAAINSK